MVRSAATEPNVKKIPINIATTLDDTGTATGRPAPLIGTISRVA
jgi:hypothetical protein